MIAPVLIAELRAAGGEAAADEDLGVILDHLQTRIEAVATAESEAFDRPLLDRLVQLRSALEPETDDAD